MVTDLFRSPPPKVPHKILFIELSEMGSAIIAYSALRRAVEMVGRENVFFLIFKKNRESVDILGLLPEANVITIVESSFTSFAFSTVQALGKLSKLHIDTVLDLELFSRCTAILSFLSGAKRRVGFHNYTEEGLFRGRLFTHYVLYNEHHHMAENFMALLRAVERPREVPLVKENMEHYLAPLPEVSISPELQVSIEERILALNPNFSPEDRLVVLNPDPGLLALRGWPIPAFADLARKLVESDPRIKIVTMGLARSESIARQVLGAIDPARVIDMSGHTANLVEVGALLRRAVLLVTNDSGPAHLAGLAGTPVITLFGPESPVKYGPLGRFTTNIHAGLACSPCYSAANHRHSPCTDNVCMKVIPVERVYRAAIEYLER
jgi:ADP-heptose:LPS heptosyltransferase